jgi:tetratricopeptide (TPR) repeat protein
VVAGGFQRAGERVRVTGRLVEVDSGRVLRSVRTDGRLDAVFELQDRVVGELVSDLRGQVAAEREAEETQVVAAYEALAKGLLNIRSDSFESLERAILFFERAVAADPGYVRAHLELGSAYAQKAQHLAAPELHERALAVLRRALELSPRTPRVWRELGQSQVALGRVEEGLESLRHAHALAPDDAAILAGLARGLFLGRGAFAEALELYERAVVLNPHAGWYWLQLAHGAALLRRFERGEAAARRAIALQEESFSGQQGVQIVGAYMRLGHVLALQGRAAEAADAFASELGFLERVDHALRSRITIELQTRLGAAQIELGERERGEAALRTALESFARRVAHGADDPFTRYYAAAAHALRGAADEALASLERAVAGLPAFTRARLRIEPEWHALRSDPRFQALVEAS